MKGIEKVLPKDMNTLLDLGCGEGLFLNGIRKKRKVKAVGIDLSKKSIFKAAKNHTDVLFIVGDAQQLPCKNEIFDAVILSHVLEHIPNEENIIKEIYRILNSTGTLLIVTPHLGLFTFMDPLNLRVRFPQFYNKIFARFSERDRREPVLHKHYSVSMLENIVTPYFKIKYISRGGFFLRPLGILLQAFIDKGTKLLKLKCLDLLLKCTYWFQKIDLLVDYGVISSDIEIVCEKTK